MMLPFDFKNDFLPVADVLSHAVLISVAIVAGSIVFLWFEEALCARIQMRPSRGFLPFFVDPIKLFLKKACIPEGAKKRVFVAAPVFAVSVALFYFFLLPFDPQMALQPESGMLYLTTLSTIGVYAFIVGAWSGGSRFTFFGAMRMLAQILSCQLVLAFTVVCLLMTAAGGKSGVWYVFPHFPLFVLFLLCAAMVTAQSPFRSPKAMRGLSSGLYAEYGGWLFWLTETAETLNRVLLSVMAVYLFFDGTAAPFGLTVLPPFVWLTVKTAAVVFLMTLMRTGFSDCRTDVLMSFSYRVLLPFVAGWTMLTAAVLLLIGG